MADAYDPHVKSVSTPTVRFELSSDGIVNSYPVDPTITPTEEIVRVDVAALDELTAGHRVALIWDLRRAPRAGATAWKALIEGLPSSICAIAAVIDEESASLGSFPETMHSLMVPFRVFDDTDAAQVWAGDQLRRLQSPGN